MSNAKDWREVKARAALRDRIAATILDYHDEWGCGLCQCGHYHEGTAEHLADAVIEELDLGIPCATTGCRMRQIARHAAAASSKLADDES